MVWLLAFLQWRTCLLGDLITSLLGVVRVETGLKLSTREGSKTLLNSLHFKLLFKKQSQIQIGVFHKAGLQSSPLFRVYVSCLFVVSMLTTMTCVTAVRLSSPAINVLRNTPLVQKVSNVLTETLRFHSHSYNNHLHIKQLKCFPKIPHKCYIGKFIVFSYFA